jgi:riboflavin kinase/FMN adenylyltransferase
MARAMNVAFGVLSFEPHPAEYFGRVHEPFRLTPFRPKARVLQKLGVDVFYALRFDAAMAERGADDVVRDMLVGGLDVAHVLVGSDFLFGRARAGDTAFLETAGETHGFGVSIYTPVIAEGDQKISSSDIRAALKRGDAKRAAHLLGHDWTVSGHVQKGDQRGRTIGFPTANVPLRGYLEPALGVYAVRVIAEGRLYQGVANFGRRPTFDKQDTLLEVHLFDFAGDLYGKSIDVAFVDYIRAERKFDGLASLKAQIEADSIEACHRLGSQP